jgi:hypothetical protein
MGEVTYEFEKDTGFMEWLRHYNDNYDSSDPDWWRSEYSGNIKGMYDAFLEGKRQGNAGLNTNSARALIR